METYQHSQVKLCLGAALREIGRRENSGLFFTDGFRVVLKGSTRCFQPDGCFVTYRSLGVNGEVVSGGVVSGRAVSRGKTNASGPLAIHDSVMDHSPLTTYHSPRVVFTHGRRLTYTGMLGVPDVMLEVASVSNLDLDYYVKGREYARLGVPEYWLLMPDGPSYRLLILLLDRKKGEYPQTEWRRNEWMYSKTFRRRFRLLCLPGVDPRLPVYELREKRGK